MNNPLISVIIPVYNVSHFLRESIESVIQQNYTNWELLLIDDGSTDGSGEILKAYESKMPGKIRYLSHGGAINKGVTASRNLGLHHAKGVYVALLDADDKWLKGKLETQLSIFRDHPELALVGGASKYWYSWDDAEKEDPVIAVGAEADRVIPPQELYFKLYPMGKGDAPCPGSLMIRTAVLRKHGGFENHFQGINQVYEDQALLIKFYLHEYCYFTSAYFDLYRQRPGSLVSDLHYKGRYREVRLFFLRWLKNYLKDAGIRDPAIQSRLKKAILWCKYPLLFKMITFARLKKSE